MAAAPVTNTRVDSALLKALARRFRWRKPLETGDFATIEEIAEAENINPSYVSRVLRMTLLAPEIVEAILAGKQPEGLTMARAMQPFPVEWHRQIFRLIEKLVQLQDWRSDSFKRERALSR